jgi:hypothetical protein
VLSGDLPKAEMINPRGAGASSAICGNRSRETATRIVPEPCCRGRRTKRVNLEGLRKRTIRRTGSGSSVLLVECLFGKFAAVKAVMRHPPRWVAIARDVQLNTRIAWTGFEVVRLQVVDRDEVNLCRPNPSRPPPVARTSTSQLGAMDGVDDHGRPGLGSWSMSQSKRLCAAMIRTY